MVLCSYLLRLGICSSVCLGENFGNFNSNLHGITRLCHFSAFHIFSSFCEDFLSMNVPQHYPAIRWNYQIIIWHGEAEPAIKERDYIQGERSDMKKWAKVL